MTKEYLLNLSIGPVQGMIAAARRTRDFWMGSTILSECAKAVAYWISTGKPISEWSPDDENSQLQVLIFPAAPNFEHLRPWAFRSDGTAPELEHNATNVILARITCQDINQYVVEAKDQVRKRWLDFVESAEAIAKEDIDRQLWSLQKNHDEFIEVYAAWVEYVPGDYGSARREVSRWLAARKSLRDFGPWLANSNGMLRRPKSSLDGARESVLKCPRPHSFSLHIRRKEELDLLGVVKRAEIGNDAIRFPSTSRFAVEPWLEGIVEDDGEGRNLLRQIREECKKLCGLGVLTQRRDHDGLDKEDDFKKFPWLKRFPFEGTPLYSFRHGSLIKDAEVHTRFQNDKAKASLDNIKRSLFKLNDLGFGEPSPYFAIILADGDRVGAALSELTTRNDPELHRQFGLSQTRFANEARKTINAGYAGATVYAGGDDFLCFAPVHQCLAIAETLKNTFASCTDKFFQDSQIVPTNPPTLSVGVAIGHFLDPLEDLLSHARAAEKRAKNPTANDREQLQISRNGLAVSIHPRGGASIIARGNWSAANSPTNLFDALNSWIQLYTRKNIPTRAAYELRRLNLDYAHDWIDTKNRSLALQTDTMRILGRKLNREGAIQDSDIGRDPLYDRIRSLQDAGQLETLAVELLIAKHLSDSIRQSQGLGLPKSPVSSVTS